MGQSLMRIVPPVDTPLVAPALRKAGFYVTVVNAGGRDGDVQVAFSVIPRRRTQEVLEIIRATNLRAFITFEEVQLIGRQAPASHLSEEPRLDIQNSVVALR